MKNSIIYDVFTVTESGKEDAKDRWRQLGVGFLNRDESLNLILDGIPVNGRLHVRVRKPKQEQEQAN